MAIKLLAAKIIDTEFYLTLDADVILTRPFQLKNLFLFTKGIIYEYLEEKKMVYYNNLIYLIVLFLILVFKYLLTLNFIKREFVLFINTNHVYCFTQIGG